MQRYFLPNDQFQEQSVIVTQDDAHHISRVMRMNEGSQFIACNEQGQAALCEIENISANEVKASIIEWISEEKELPVHVTAFAFADPANRG